MTIFPDFTPYGYDVIEQLGNNRQGGRVTYKARDINTQETVVIKQFLFATANDWEPYQAVQREIETLQTLNHPKIPRYIRHFDPGNGICLVQEYKKAKNLSKFYQLNPENIKSIAITILKILVYLQEQNPLIIHRDIKPENILIDDNFNVYLVDFGFARIGDGSLAASSITGGTLGFMPPEQLHNYKLTKASDLYSLGVTLISLITATKSQDIGSLFNFKHNCIQFKDKVSGYSFSFIDWLEKMVQPDPNDRFPDAETALKELESLYMNRLPKVRLSCSSIQLSAQKIRQKLTTTITIENPIPDTILEGNWEVQANINDPPHNPDKHQWIKFSPRTFRGNNIQCQITVDTKNLIPNIEYKRWILLHTNSQPETYTIDLTVKTGFEKEEVKPLPYVTLIFSGIIAIISTIIILFSIAYASSQLMPLFQLFFSSLFEEDIAEIIFNCLFYIGGIGMLGGMIVGIIIAVLVSILGYILGSILGFENDKLRTLFGYFESDNPNPGIVSTIGLLTGFLTGLGAGIISGMLSYPNYQHSNNYSFEEAEIIQFLIIGGISTLVIALGILSIIIIASAASQNFQRNSISKPQAILLSRLIPSFGIILGIGLNLGSFNPVIISLLAATSLPVVSIITSHNLKRRKQLIQQRKKEEHLIKP